MKKIYPKEWVKLHPYRQTDDIDHYYTDIANQIYQVLQTHLADGMFDDDEDIRYASLCLTAWFEDVISQIGILYRRMQEALRELASLLSTERGVLP